MATFRSCITEALQKGDIDADSARLAEDAYDDAYEATASTLGPIDADRAGADAAMARLEAEAIEARRRRQLSIRTRRTALETIAGYKERRGYQGVQALGGGGGKPPKEGWTQGGAPPPEGPGSRGAAAAKALELLIENKPGLSGAPGASVEGRYRTLRGQFDARVAELIETFETRTGFDRPGRAHSDNLVREAFGEDTGDKAAKALAEAWRDTAEDARRLFNAAGGAIGKLDDWGMPQRHDALRIRQAGRAAWVEAILPRLAREKMIDRVTGQPFTERRLRAVLGETWESIATGGASKKQPGEHVGLGMLAKRRNEERFLVFRSAEDWIGYQKDFGEGDPFQAMMGHLDDMARDIAQMQILGPNPAHQFQWLVNFARREAALEEAAGVTGARDRAEGMVATAGNMLAHLNGDLSAPVNSKLSQVSGTIRSGLTSVMLGSAVLGELGSSAYFGRQARAFAGLNRNGDMGQLVRLLASPHERAIARRSGFIIEQATDGFIRDTQDNLRLLTVGNKGVAGLNPLARRLPVFTLRMSGLTAAVQARKRSHRFEFMGRLQDLRDRTLAEIRAGDAGDRAFGDWLDARGFTEDDWAVIRSTPAWEPRPGAAFIRPSDVAIPELALRLGEAIEIETRFLTPETTLWTRAKLLRDRPGDLQGEFMRSFHMFKGFTVTASHIYGEEIAVRGGRQGGLAGAGLIAGLASQAMIWLTVGGAVNLQLREMAKGNDPRPMDKWEFWGAAMMQGGGVGIFGDFLYAAQARNGLTAPATGYGPIGQLVADLWGLTGGNVQQIAEGLDEGETVGEAVEGARIGRDAARFLTRYNPLATMWWSRAAWSRMVGDNLQRALDPEAEAEFARRARRMERERGQGQWWPEGEGAPTRAPDLANMAGAS